ncbi:MAG: CoA transferase [Rhodospirillales bacterium]|nr:CoA transferase [Rhodospirillales bacterium]MBO6786512.1 CoA transferase [Rhodospirillales bacterium]
MTAQSASKGALDGIKVLDLSRVLAGPWCAMVLGDLGADVIKIESPEGDDVRHFGPPFKNGESAYFMVAGRNKRSVVADLKTEEGLALVKRLALTADILVENFRKGTLEKFGLAPDELRKENPGLIVCSVSGYGRTGQMSERAGYDFVIQAESGLMSIIGDEDTEPMKVGAAVTDIVAGQYATQGVLAALYHREKTGEGQDVDISLLDGAATLLANQAAAYLMTGDRPPRLGNDHPTVCPYRPFETADYPIALAIGANRQFRKLCKVMGFAELADDPRFATNPARVENRVALYEILEATFLTRTRDEWLAALHAEGLPAGAIRTVDQVMEAPELAERGVVQEVVHETVGPMRIVASPIKLSKTPPRVYFAPRPLGADGDNPDWL